MGRIEIEERACIEVGNLIRGLACTVKQDDFNDPRFYPCADQEEVASRYFFFMVAIDHRAGVPGRPFEGYVEGILFHGADLLWRLGKLRLSVDPRFFDPRRMGSIRGEEVAEWLKVEKPRLLTVRDPEVRAMLLRDCAMKLIKLYRGSVLSMIKSSDNMLVKGDGSGFIERLREFKAYEDPVGKKSYLLVKFLERRGLLSVVDVENIHVPVDNHLTRIALRLGIIDIRDEGLLFKVERGLEVGLKDDVDIRLTCRGAFKAISEEANVSPTILDDFLWALGRSCCIREGPICEGPCAKVHRCSLGTIWSCAGLCPLYAACKGAVDVRRRKLTEHLFIDTWYY